MVLSLLSLALSASGFARGKKAPRPSTPDRVWVTASDGSKSCEQGSGTPLENGRATLQSAGIEVFDAQKGQDGMAHIQMCGASTGSQNTYQIAVADVAKAEKLGFKLKPTPTHTP
jgi:hypothetical protein